MSVRFLEELRTFLEKKYPEWQIFTAFIWKQLVLKSKCGL